MNSEHEHEHRVGARQRSSPFSRIERLSPLMVALYLALLAITVMFVMLVVAYVVTRQRSGVPTGLHALPRYFSLSTIVLVVSSYTIGQAPRLYAQDDLSSLARCLGATLLLGAIFSGLQVLGWRELMMQGVTF
ncbi:MAG TPA: cytochrome c oxidase subunit III, partial [Hymenobacter sp.]